MKILDGFLYTNDHEWVKKEGEFYLVGITDFAQSELGEIVYVEVDELDVPLSAGDQFGTVEAVKTVSDLFMPMEGVVVEVNPDLEDAPEKVNKDPYGEGWMIKIKASEEVDLSHLLSAAAYKAQIEA